MVKHDVLVRGVDTQGTPQLKPVLLQMHNTDFPTHFLQDLAHPDQLPVSSTVAVASSAASPATLFQPVQRIVHLAMVQLNCDTLGFPPLATTRVESAGLVIRRVFRQPGDPNIPGSKALDDVSAPPWGWMRKADGAFDWIKLSPGQQTQDPDPGKRPQLHSGSVALDQLLAAMSLSSAMTETVTPAFVAPPDICNALGRAIVYGLIPTASSEVSDSQPAPPSFDDPRDRQLLVDNLPTFLKGGPPSAPFPDTPVTPQWLSDDFLQNHQPAFSDSDISLFQAFTATLRMLQSVFGALDNTTEGQKILELLNRYNVIQNVPTVDFTGATISVPVAIPMGDFYASAATALLGPDTTLTSSITMPIAWDSISDQDQQTLVDRLVAALGPQTAKVLAPQGRFQDSTRLYTVRLFLRIKPEDPACPAQLIWSCPSEPFRIAAWYESAGRPHPPIALPDPSKLRSLAKPNASFAVPAGLMNAIQGSSLSGMMKGKSGGGGITIDWICGFNIPLITICAFFVLNIFFSLLAIIFFWLPFFKICIPIPVPKPSDGDH
jgi:hypothetical protein